MPVSFSPTRAHRIDFVSPYIDLRRQIGSRARVSPRVSFSPARSTLALYLQRAFKDPLCSFVSCIPSVSESVSLRVAGTCNDFLRCRAEIFLAFERGFNKPDKILDGSSYRCDSQLVLARIRSRFEKRPPLSSRNLKTILLPFPNPSLEKFPTSRSFVASIKQK